MSRRTLPRARLGKPAFGTRAGVWVSLSICLACTDGGQSFDDGLDGLGKTNHNEADKHRELPREVDAAAGPSSEAVAVDAGSPARASLETDAGVVSDPLFGLRDSGASDDDPPSSPGATTAPLSEPDTPAEAPLSSAAPLSSVAPGDTAAPAVTPLDAGLGASIEPETESSWSRAVPGVLLIADGELGQSGFLPDPALDATGATMQGSWFTYDDTTECPAEERPRPGMISPSMGNTFLPSLYANAQLEPFPPEFDAPNEAALRFWGGGYEKWGAGMSIGFDMSSGSAEPYDLAAQGFSGLRFWARSGADDLDLRVLIQDEYVVPSAGLCCYLDPNMCGENTCGRVESQGCFDAAFTIIALTNEWQLFELPFTEFARGGWGSYHDAVPPPSLSLTTAYQLSFEVSTMPDFDVYIDNVGFTLADSE